MKFNNAVEVSNMIIRSSGFGKLGVSQLPSNRLTSFPNLGDVYVFIDLFDFLLIRRVILNDYFTARQKEAELGLLGLNSDKKRFK